MATKVFKLIVIVPIYLFLIIEGFIGGLADPTDIWDDLMKWVNR